MLNIFNNEVKLLKFANSALLTAFIMFSLSLYCAYAMESKLPIAIVIALHLIQIVLAGLFKLAHVLRLIAQKNLGMVPG